MSEYTSVPFRIGRSVRGHAFVLPLFLCGSALTVVACVVIPFVVIPQPQLKFQARDSHETAAQKEKPPNSATRELQTIVHDFGVVSPLKSLTCTLPIKNNSRETWSVQEIKTSCGCAIANIQPKVIMPGKSATINVGYKPGNSTADEERSLQIIFQEPLAPLVHIRVAAKVRPELSVSQVDFQVSEQNGAWPPVKFTVSNYGASTWENVTISSLNGFHRIESIEEERLLPSTNHYPRQRWIVVLRPSLSNESSEGIVIDNIRVTPSGSCPSLSENVGVRLKRDLPISFYPSQVTVCNPAPNLSSTFTLRAVLNKSLAKSDRIQVGVSLEGLNGTASATTKRLDSHLLELTVLLTPGGELASTTHGRLKVSITGLTESTSTIPLIFIRK